MPPAVRETLRRAYLGVFGPDGCLEPDDAEAWTLVNEGTGHRRMRDVPLYAGMGLGMERADPDMPGVHHHPLSEGISRNFYLQWQAVMARYGARQQEFGDPAAEDHGATTHGGGL